MIKNLRFKKTFGLRFCMACYILIMFSTIPSLTMNMMVNHRLNIKDGTANGFISLIFFSSFFFAVVMMRNLVTRNCLSSYNNCLTIEPKLSRLLISSLKPAWIHFPILVLPPLISFTASGGTPAYAGVGLIGTILALGSYILTLDIPFRTRKQILKEINAIS